VLAGLFAVGDWYAVARSRRSVEYACKPAAALAFLATAVALDPTFGDTRTWFCVALAFCVAGDVFLMLPRDAFVAGLAAFLVAQVCFAVGFALHPSSTVAVAVGVAVVVMFAVPLAVRFIGALRSSGHGALAGPVFAYVVAIGGMLACAIGSGVVAGVAGAGLFFVSDSLIAETRFVGPRRWGPVAVMVTYHLALAGLVVSLTA
jgi:uncharacterized membrane protein YhhN